MIYHKQIYHIQNAMPGGGIMEKCLICGVEKSGGPDTCKLCGIKAACHIIEGGFLFCCEICAEHFRRIYACSDSKQRKRMIENKVVI